VGGVRASNSHVVRRVVAGERGAHRDIVLLNAAAGLVIAGAADSMEQGIERASASIDSGRASATLDALVVASQAALPGAGTLA